ncbi:MAG: hypothetical protein IT454_19975 [Planctomycetes bacterium]|nr:hypothetical protein [Planctomycetota bacterium]
MFKLDVGSRVLQIPISVPILLLSALTGIFLAAFPDFTLDFVESALPRPLGVVLRRIAGRGPIASTNPANHAPTTTITQGVLERIDEAERRIQSVQRRTQLSVLTIVLVAILLGNAVLTSLRSVSVEANEMRLARTLQTSALSFASGDHIRRELQSLVDLHQPPPEATSSPSISLVSCLQLLYSDHVTSPHEFDKAERALYEMHLYSRVHATRLLDMGRVVAALSPEMDGESRAAVLSVLAMVCNDLGEQGTLLEYHLQAFQLARGAEAEISKLQLPSEALTMNTLGVAVASILRQYTEFEDRFRHARPDEYTFMARALAFDAPLEYGEMAYQAYSAYLAQRQPLSVLASTRCANNISDLGILLLHESHVAGRQFLGTTPLAREYCSSFTTTDSGILASTLDSLESNLIVARSLGGSPTGATAYTLAQLYSVAGSVSVTVSFKDEPWCAPQLLAERCITRLVEARSNGIDRRYFQESLADAMLLEWIWQQPEHRARLIELSRESR